MKYTLRTYKTIDKRFITQWKALWKKAVNANVYNSYDWFALYTKGMKVSDFTIHAVYENENLAGVLVLTSSKKFGIPVRTPLGYDRVVNTPFLMKSYDGELLKYLFEDCITKEHLFIPKIDMKEVELLKTLFPDVFLSLISVNPYITLDQEPLRFLSKFRDKAMKRIIKHNPGLSVDVFGPEDDLEEKLSIMFDIDTQSGKKRQSMDIFSSETNRKIFWEFVTYCKKYIRIAILSYKDKPIAYIFNFVYKGQFVDYQTSYLFEYRHLSPGKMVIYLLLQKLKDSEFQIFDFCGGISRYKREFTPQYYTQFDLYSSPHLVISFWWKALNTLRRVKQILFPIKETRDHEFLFREYTIGRTY